MFFHFKQTKKTMKKTIHLLPAISVLLVSLGCESNNNQVDKRFNHKIDTVSPDSGFVKFDPSKMDSNPQKRKKIIRVVSGKESLRRKSGRNN